VYRFFFQNKITFLFFVVVLGAVFAHLPPWAEGPAVPGLTCSRVLDEEEDFADLVQAGAKAATGKPSSVVSRCPAKKELVLKELQKYFLFTSHLLGPTDPKSYCKKLNTNPLSKT